MRFGVVVFPGSNCDVDVYHSVRDVIGEEAAFVWHDTPAPERFDCLVLPGGFSYGDYLRAGAIARFARVMDYVRTFAEKGGPVIGICNGFQILCEAGLLPGALHRNEGLRFLCHDVHLRVERTDTPFTALSQEGDVLRMPIAHGEGNYFVDAATRKRLEDNRQVVFRYASADGTVNAGSNPNGSVGNIAGICNRAGNVLGMMPHPERNVENLMGNGDGRRIFDSIVRAHAVARA